MKYFTTLRNLQMLIVFFFKTAAVSFAAFKLPPEFQLIPSPVKIEAVQGAPLQYNGITSIEPVNCSRPVAGPIISSIPLFAKSGAKLILTIDASDPRLPLSTQGYVLTLESSGGTLNARSQTGLFYGLQTLEQLLSDSRDADTPIPPCRITDYPAIEYRTVHFDVKHHLDTMKYYYDMVDHLASYKINGIIFEFEDKLRYRRQPLVGASNAISIEEMAALTRYARERHIDISPLIQGLGHASYILKHEEYTTLRDAPDDSWSFCALNQGTYDVLFDLYRDALEATPGSKFLHVGGDEVGELGKSALSISSGKSALELQLYWLGKVSEFARNEGRIPITWDDMILKNGGVYPTIDKKNMTKEDSDHLWLNAQKKLEELIEQFPTNCIYMRWYYKSPMPFGNTKAIEWFNSHELQVFGATAVQPMDPLMPRNRLTAISEFDQLAAEKNIAGMLATCWDDASPHAETLWQGIIAHAQYSWSPRTLDLDEYRSAWLHREFGSNPGEDNLFRFYDDLALALDFWDTALSEVYYGKTRHQWVYNRQGGGLRPENQRLIDLPDANRPGQWSGTYAARLERAAAEIVRYGKISSKLDRLARIARRNIYSIQIFQAINELQIQTPELLLALKEFDLASSEDKPIALRKVFGRCDEFERVWMNLQSVYSQTRFLSNPPDYLLENNPFGHHSHLADRQNDIGWMVNMEKRFIGETIQWANKQSLSPAIKIR